MYELIYKLNGHFIVGQNIFLNRYGLANYVIYLGHSEAGACYIKRFRHLPILSDTLL